MSDRNNQNPDLSKADRIARYKEERRRQLGTQIEARLAEERGTVRREPPATSQQQNGSSCSPRTTKASRLRAAQVALENGTAAGRGQMAGANSSEKISTLSSTTRTSTKTPDTNSSHASEKDKSSKRKSFLNRSLNSEEVTPQETLMDDDKFVTRRKRRIYPLVETKNSETTVSYKNSTTNITATTSQPSFSDSVFTATANPIRTTPKKSQLAVHMDNARKGITPENLSRKKSTTANSTRSSLSPDKTFKIPNGTNIITTQTSKFNKENIRQQVTPTREIRPKVKADDHRINTTNIRLNEISALTKETLARERLTNRSRNSPVQELPVTKTSRNRSSPVKELSSGKNAPSSSSSSSKCRNSSEKAGPSILKKKSLEEPEFLQPFNPPPVSILKRKVSQDDRGEATTTATHTPPVTFSPNVKEPSTSFGSSRKQQGILKKRRSLDEALVLRRRSCSPEAAKGDGRSILKNQKRRSSLEELTRLDSPESSNNNNNIQGILKRRSSKYNEDELTDQSFSSPQGILKRRSGASSAGSTTANNSQNPTPHVSITTAVILAAASGAEMVLEPENNVGTSSVRPILKKKSISDEQSSASFSDNSYADLPVLMRPILKKKSSGDAEEGEDKPRPILKSWRGSIEKEPGGWDVANNNNNTNNNNNNIISNQQTETVGVRPILKSSREDFSAEVEEGSGVSREVLRRHRQRRSHTVCGVVDADDGDRRKEDIVDDVEEEKKKRRSVSELVTSFEEATRVTNATGAIPKTRRVTGKRQGERYKTQPITSDEVEASLLYVAKPTYPDSLSRQYSLTSSSSALTSSGVVRDPLADFLDGFGEHYVERHNSCVKVSSDSAFQSLLDGLEMEGVVETEVKEISPKSVRGKGGAVGAGGLDQLMKAIANEAKAVKLNKGLTDVESRKQTSFEPEKPRNLRRTTQPVTQNEVQEASKLQEDDDPANLSLSERIRRFNEKLRTQDKKSPRIEPNVTKLSLNKTPDATRDEGISSDNESDDAAYGARQRPDAGTDRYASRYTKKTHLNVDNMSDSDETRAQRGLTRSFSARVSSTSESSRRRQEEGVGGRSGWDSTTSESESSGAKEVRRILEGEGSGASVKRALEGLLSKNKSSANVGNDAKVTVRRSQTVNYKRNSNKKGDMPQTIAELQATLQKKGESEWRKRFGQNNAVDDELKLLKDKNKYNVELSEKTTILASKKDELDAASKKWKSRVEKSDADKFSVSGRMEKSKETIPVNIPTMDEFKKTPQAKRFRGKEKDSSSTPTSPEKNGHSGLKRSQSNPDPSHQLSPFRTASSTQKIVTKNVTVLRPDDFTFKNFYKSVDAPPRLLVSDDQERLTSTVVFATTDLDAIARDGTLLAQKKNVRVQKRRVATKNPIRALAERDDIKQEYTEVLTGVAERETKRLNIEKLAKSSSNFAIEALAGLASKEDFKSVPLKKNTGSATALLPHKDVMLIQVKGRRHVQLRLVEPVATSLNDGDCFLLIAHNRLYVYNGSFSNVIEQARASDVAGSIQKTNDLGCRINGNNNNNNDRVVYVAGKEGTANGKEEKGFWKTLGVEEASGGRGMVANAGNPSEDEIYEANVALTNMIYRLENDELVPIDEYWGAAPKYEMLTSTSVYVFDFGSEMYVWSGKNADAIEKQNVLKLAKELWNEGYDYTDCPVCPINVASVLGERQRQQQQIKVDVKRPDWTLFAKLTQHRETILFKEKFTDWPDFSRVIRVKGDASDGKHTTNDVSFDIKPIDVDVLLSDAPNAPDLVVEGNHLGRGDSYFDEETNRRFEFDTSDLKVWKITENSYELMDHKLHGQFYEADSYIIRWRYRVTVKGRELSGRPSKYAQVGRDSTAYFYWQGARASTNEKGVAALLTVELDSESAPQIRVTQGNEPAAFLRLFDGGMMVHMGKMADKGEREGCRLYITRGEIEQETYLLEVSCNAEQLRSRSSLALCDARKNRVSVWHGCKSSDRTRKAIRTSIDKLIANDRKLRGVNLREGATVVEIEEGREQGTCFDSTTTPAFEGRSERYVSLLRDARRFDFTPRFFSFSGVSGRFAATEIVSAHRSEHACPMPVLQDQLYSASQPALFLIDNHHELWLWQGWWPPMENEEGVAIAPSDQAGSGAIRWQAERRAAMRTVLDYWRRKRSASGGEERGEAGEDDDEKVRARLVWAGFEPMEFRNLFPFWTVREDVKELNGKERRHLQERSLEEELALLSRTEFPLAELLERPLPEGVDPTHLEDYLSRDDFEKILSMSKEEFQRLPIWKQSALKKERGLF